MSELTARMDGYSAEELTARIENAERALKYLAKVRRDLEKVLQQEGRGVVDPPAEEPAIPQAGVTADIDTPPRDRRGVVDRAEADRMLYMQAQLQRVAPEFYGFLAMHGPQALEACAMAYIRLARVSV